MPISRDSRSQYRLEDQSSFWGFLVQVFIRRFTRRAVTNAFRARLIKVIMRFPLRTGVEKRGGRY